MKKTAVRMKDIYRVLRISPSQVWQLQARGAVREPEKKGTISVQFIEDLILWHEQARGEIPREAMDLLRKAREETGEPHE